MTVPVLKLFIGVPAYGGFVRSETIKMWLELGRSIAEAGDRFELIGIANLDTQPIDRARNFLVAHAMQANADWLLMIDADTWVESITMPDGIETAGFQLLRMISQADRANVAVVGAPVQRRGGEGLNVTGVPLVGPKISLRVKDPPMLPELRSCDSIGAAIMAIRLDKIGEITFKWTDTLGEDLNFCKDVREAGGRIYVDGRVKSAHMDRPTPLYSR